MKKLDLIFTAAEMFFSYLYLLNQTKLYQIIMHLIVLCYFVSDARLKASLKSTETRHGRDESFARTEYLHARLELLIRGISTGFSRGKTAPTQFLHGLDMHNDVLSYVLRLTHRNSHAVNSRLVQLMEVTDYIRSEFTQMML